VFFTTFRARNIGGFEGDIGRSPGLACSARRINCKGVNGDPGDEVDLSERELRPLGVDKEKEGRSGAVGSGVCGASGRSCISGASGISGASCNVVELTHLSS